MVYRNPLIDHINVCEPTITETGLLDPTHEGTTFLQNIGNYLAIDQLQQTKRLES